MNQAKAAVSSFLHKDGKHDTTVHETVNPAITNEKIHRSQRNEAQTVVDREVHQDHHHTSVQPITHKEVLPEQHSHNMGAVEHRNVSHGNDEHVRDRLAAEKAQFKNTREVGEVQHTHGTAAAVTGEHIHHHVHENIQPVIQKETIQPSVVHTTVPIHEVHHNEAKHHTASALPAVTLDEFKHQGGNLTGREERTDAFSGEPKTVGGTLGGHGARGTTSLTENDRAGHHNSKNSGLTGTTNSHHNATGSGLTGTHNTDYNSTGSGLTGNNSTHHNSTSSGLTGTTNSHHNATTGSGLAGTTNNGLRNETSQSTVGNDSYGNVKKPSLMDKLNPKIDSNGDGKAGFMK